MKQALISTEEPVLTGYRVAEVIDYIFEVASPLFWVECADDVVADYFWFDPTDGQIKIIPEPQPQPQPVSNGAQEL